MTITKREGPLSDLKVLALTQAWAGPFATELLAFLGADVVQIESRSRPDNFRGSYEGVIPSALRQRPSAVHPWNVAASYNAVNLCKRGVTLDLSSEQGLAIFRRMVPRFDIVAENFSPRVMQNFGLHYEALKEIRQDIIMLSMSAYGATGPYSNFPGIGGTIEAMSGMTSLLGYPGGPGMNSGTMYPDPVAGYMGAAAVMMALHWRDISGEGQWIDLSMQEANMAMIGDAVLEYQLTGNVRGPMGNRHPLISPHGIYRCADGEWVALAACDDSAFAELARVAGRPDWPADIRYKDARARVAHAEALDVEVEAWTASLASSEVEAVLADTAVANARVLKADEVIERPELWEDGILRRLDHPEAGEHVYVGAPWRFDGRELGPFTPSPLLGQHGREVLREFAGVDDAQYDELVAAGITGEGPPA